MPPSATARTTGSAPPAEPATTDDRGPRHGADAAIEAPRLTCGRALSSRTRPCGGSGELAGASEQRRLRSRLALPFRLAPALVRGQGRVDPVEHLVHRSL